MSLFQKPSCSIILRLLQSLKCCTLVRFDAVPKRQLILKGLVGILNSPKKRTKKLTYSTMTPQVDLFSFVFWEN